MLISETFVNVTEGYRFSEGEQYEPFTDDVGELFRNLRSEYGRCVSSIYVDVDGGPPKRVGWVFQKRDRYEDTRETYLREVWVTLHDAKDTVTRQSHFKTLGG
jgi:hypothetical protein